MIPWSLGGLDCLGLFFLSSMTLTHSFLRMMRFEIHHSDLPGAIIFLSIIYTKRLKELVSSSGSGMGLKGWEKEAYQNQAVPAGPKTMYNHIFVFLSHCHRTSSNLYLSC